MSLFDSTPPEAPDSPGTQRPLAERMRPHSLEDLIGQDHILGPGKPLRRQIERDELTSIILWGPPGVGKTTLAISSRTSPAASSFRSAPCSPASRKSRP